MVMYLDSNNTEVTLLAGIAGPDANVAALVSRLLPLGNSRMSRVVAQLGCDHSLHQHVP